MKFLDRLPFLPQHPGQRELVFVAVLVAVIAIAGFLGGYTGLLYKDVPSSTPTATLTSTPPATSTPSP